MLKWLFDLFSKKPEPVIEEDRWQTPTQRFTPQSKPERNHLSGKLRVPLKGNGSFSFDIVGEANYQAELEAVAGRKTTEGKNFLCRATISLEPQNPYDPNAVKVEIAGKTVGYFSKADAKDYAGQLSGSGQSITSDEVAAKIIGGFKSKSKEGHFGVKLDITRHA